MRPTVNVPAGFALVLALAAARTAAAQGSAPPLPQRLYAVVQLAAPRTGYLYTEIVVDAATARVTTCPTLGPAEERCHGPLRVTVLSATDRAELTRLWTALHVPAPCSVVYPSNAPRYRLWAGAWQNEGNLLSAATHQTMGYQPCVAGGRLAWWIVGLNDHPTP